MIGELPKGIDPRVLEDHLLGRGMKARIDRRPDGGAVVWILDEDHVDPARRELQEYLAAPDDPRFRASAPKASEVRKAEARRDREFRKNYREAGDLWGAPTLRQRPVTILTVAIAAAVYILQNMGYAPRVVDALAFFSLADWPPENRPRLGLTDVLDGEVWRLVTPAFLHFSGMHILFNAWWMVVLGSAIERRRGSWRLLLLIVGTAALSNLTEYESMERLRVGAPGESRFVPFGGLSGVNYALFGYVWMMGEYHPEEGLGIDSRNTTILLIWLVLGFTGYLGPIANFAHLGGLAVGMALGRARY